MKKILTLLIIIVLTSAVTVVYYTNNNKHLEFLENYVENFKDNLFNLRLKYEISKAEKEENILHNDDTQQEESIENITDTQEHTSNVIKEPDKNEGDNHDYDEVHLTKKFVLKSDPIALNNAGNARFLRYKNGIICALENSVTLYSKNGDVKWTRSVQISDPVLKVSGDYYLLFEQNGKKAAVYSDNRLLYTKESSNIILNGDISSNGDCVLVTQMPYYKGSVMVLNKSGEEIFIRNFGSENVIKAAISNSRKLAVALLSVRTNAYSRIAFFDINKTDEESSTEYNDTIIFDIDFSTNSLIAYGDNKIMSVNPNGRENWLYEFNEKILKHYSKDNANVRLLLFDNNNNAELNVLTSSGNIRPSINTNVVPDFSDIYDGSIIYNNLRNLYLTQLNGETLAKFSASRDIKKAYFIDNDNIVVVYNQSLEFLSVEKIQEQKNNTEE